MSANYILPLKAPTPLPASGVDTVTFKVWKNTLIAHIQQDVNHHNFMPGGRYEEWRAAEYGPRIEALDDEDPDKLVIDDVYTDTHTHKQAQVMKIPEGQNWPQVKMK